MAADHRQRRECMHCGSTNVKVEQFEGQQRLSPGGIAWRLRCQEPDCGLPTALPAD